VNAVCIVGILIGLVAAMLPWASESGTNLLTERSYSYDIHAINDFDWLGRLFIIAGLVFVLGTAICLLTPIAFLGQSAGLIMFFYSYSDYQSAARLTFGPYCFRLEIGFYLGIVSAVVIFASWIRPVMIGNVSKESCLLRDKSLTIRCRRCEVRRVREKRP